MHTKETQERDDLAWRGTYWYRTERGTDDVRVHLYDCDQARMSVLIHTADYVFGSVINWVGPYDDLDEAISDASVFNKVFGCVECGTVSRDTEITVPRTPARKSWFQRIC